jgi:hypothetical protein
MKKPINIFNNPTAITKSDVIVGICVNGTFFFVYGREQYKTNTLVDKLTFKINMN